MNKRIKELLVKHIAPPALAVTRDLENQHTAHVTYTVSQAEMETLLSAVVQECANAAVQKDAGMAYTVDAAGYVAAGRSTAAQMIREHFGVREQTESQKMAAAGYTRRPRGWTKEGTE